MSCSLPPNLRPVFSGSPMRWSPMPSNHYQIFSVRLSSGEAWWSRRNRRMKSTLTDTARPSRSRQPSFRPCSCWPRDGLSSRRCERSPNATKPPRRLRSWCWSWSLALKKDCFVSFGGNRSPPKVRPCTQTPGIIAPMRLLRWLRPSASVSRCWVAKVTNRLTTWRRL